MKNVFLILVLIFSVLPSFAVSLEGRVINNVRNDVFANTQKNINLSPYSELAKNKVNGYRVDYDDGSYSISEGQTTFVYDKFANLSIIALYDKNVFEYPRIQRRYAVPSGKLESVSYGVSEGNGYVFNPDSSLRGIWDNFIFYKNGKAIKSANMYIY